MEVLWSDVCLGNLSTHDTPTNADDAINEDTEDNGNTRQTIHNYIANAKWVEKPVTPKLCKDNEFN